MIRPSRFARALGALALALLPTLTPADDLADEADLHFELGNEAYRNRDFRGALEHFLASNRLVANRNVVFNIARAYEQLQRYADAHRYYSLALETETDRQSQANLRASLARIAPYVAVLRVATEPPGATLYIDRRDLGPRGAAPRSLAFAPGRVRVIAELDGYEPAESPPVDLRLGQESPVTLRLVPILGRVRVEGDTPGAEVRVDSDDGPVRGRVPCELELPPGPHTLIVSAVGFQVTRETVTVEARGSATVRPTLAPVTGALLVSADERDALVEVDGHPVGFTPAVTTPQIGQRRVRVSLSGYRPVEQVVTVRRDAQLSLNLQLRQIEEVSAASRATESVEDAPSSVSLVSGQEIRAMGYPTVAEALRGVRGVFLSDDRLYSSVGFRGFGRPGDYGNRVLVLVDGMPTNDNWVNSSYVGFDARTDLDDVERIEVVRGPGSVLYGTGAFSGVINVVTRGRPTARAVELSTGTSEYGVARLRGSVRTPLGRDGGLWLSVSGAQAAGRDFAFPQYARPASGADPGFDGLVRGADGFTAGTVTGRFFYRSLTAQWFFHSREKQFPTGAYDTVPGDPRNQATDTRGLFELRFEPRLSDRVQLLSRAFLNYYRYRSTYVYTDSVEDPGQETFNGAWGGAEMRLALQPSAGLRFNVGAEVQRHFLVEQRSGTASNPIEGLNESDPYTQAAGYATADWSPTERFRASLATRFDVYSYDATGSRESQTLSSFNPRLALIFRPSPRDTVKLMGGRAFRAPSIYERYYQNGGRTQIPGGNLRPETIVSAELEYTRRLSNTVSVTASGYLNYIQDLIALRPLATNADISQYQNTGVPVLTLGGEAELRREWRQGWMLSASYAFQRSSYVESGAATLRQVPNAPEQLVGFRAAAPIVPELFTLMTRLAVTGPRWDRNDGVGDPPQQRTESAVIADLVLSGRAQRWNLRYNAGVYNLFDWRYTAPVSVEFPQNTTRVLQNGRTLLASVAWSF
ncbi:MAG: TonB-dependent receptor [Myxococcales bacterium]|nr:TonB-dependent receptor [Myxococcales bacterium]